jgi:mRNA-degrading endonuclease RelE of RelBE toxin-antitoxin system
MIIRFSDKAKKQTQKLPRHIQEKLRKQLLYLLVNPRHPSLRVKKMQGLDAFEARIDYQYRFAFETDGEAIHLLAVGPHDAGLGKK